MNIYCLVAITILFINLLLGALGAKGLKAAKATGLSINKKDYEFASVLAVGYGVLRLFPGIASYKNIRIRQVILVRNRNPLQAREQWNAILANVLAGFFVISACLSMLVAVISMSGSAKPGDVSTVAFVFCGMAVMIPVGLFSRIQKKENERVDRMVEELPNLINKMIIFLNTGMSMNRIIDKIGSTDIDNPLYDEFRIIKADLTYGIPLRESLISMKERCKCNELTHFYMILEQNISKGTKDCDTALTSLCLELWDKNSEKIKRKGSSIQEKLMIPSIVLMVASMIITVVPAFISLK